MAEAQTHEPDIRAKVTIKDIGCDPKRAVREDKAVILARFWGIVESVKYVMNRQTGDTNIALLGNFMAQNMETGEVFRSGVMYLPAGIHDTISAPFVRAKDTHAEVPPIKFGIEISSVPAKNPVGYTYSGKPLFKPEGADPLAEMNKELIADIKKLPAPKK